MADGSTPCDPAWNMSEEELLRKFEWARHANLRVVSQTLEETACALIAVRKHMIDKDHDAYHPILLIEQALIRADEGLDKVLKVLDPDGEEPSDG